MFIEDVARLLFWILATVLAVNLLFLFLVLRRRLRLERYFLVKDSAREILRHPVELLAAGHLPLERVGELQREARSKPAREALHELLLGAINRDSAGRLSEALFTLGSVDLWARQAFGRSRAHAMVDRSIHRAWLEQPTNGHNRVLDPFRRLKVAALPRALAVRSLAQLAPEFAQVFLVEASSDPASEVRELAIAGMGRSQHHTLVAPLMAELRRSVTDQNDVSWRWVKIALTHFGLEHLPQFVPHLTDPLPRMRFSVVDIAGQVCALAAKEGLLNKNDFSPDFYGVFLENVVNDESPDVRARSAAVIKHFRDQRSMRALRQLLTDENEFVRLHAVRACGDRFYGDLLADLTRCLHDPHWRVREAAVQALLTFGNSGLEEVFRVFLETDDADTAHQIVDGMQRGGAMSLLLTSLAAEGHQSSMASAVCQKMALLGDTVFLNRALAGVDNPSVRLSLMDALMVAPDEEYLSILSSIATVDDGVAGERASAILRLSGAVSAAKH